MRPTCFVLAILALATPADAEFVIVSTQPAESGADSAPPAATAPTTPTPRPNPKRRPASAEPALAGFGDQVSLTFAVRQIIPARYRVAWGDAVDRDAPVDWKGGKPWRATLADAVRPLGLVVSVTGTTVTIGSPAPAR